jgi:endo-1,4-beta-xylanase
MEKYNTVIPKLISCAILLVTFQVAFAQYDGIHDEIAKHRKGTLTIQAKPGEKIIVEQLRHEFWFGAAISNQFGTGNMPENDRKQYEEKFLMNFNSAVTENAVKWGSMEPQKGQVNYAAVDGILNWA